MVVSKKYTCNPKCTQLRQSSIKDLRTIAFGYIETYGFESAAIVHTVGGKECESRQKP